MDRRPKPVHLFLDTVLIATVTTWADKPRASYEVGGVTYQVSGDLRVAERGGGPGFEVQLRRRD